MWKIRRSGACKEGNPPHGAKADSRLSHRFRTHSDTVSDTASSRYARARRHAYLLLAGSDGVGGDGGSAPAPSADGSGLGAGRKIMLVTCVTFVISVTDSAGARSWCRTSTRSATFSIPFATPTSIANVVSAPRAAVATLRSRGISGLPSCCLYTA